MMKKISVKHLSELNSAAHTIISDMGKNRIFALYGTMGAGKTTLIKEFCNVLGVNEVVSSPTFALVNEYSSESGNPVYHFDFYRIKKLDEVFDIGYEEYFYSGDFCFIEWPELVTELLPESYVYILIEEKSDGSREISYSVKS